LLLILKGREKAIERNLELALFTAWQTARLSTFHGGKLNSLANEMEKLRPQAKRQQTNEEILSAMRMIRATMGTQEESSHSG
jgi:hypothetical protein